MASEPLTTKSERENIVRPQGDKIESNLVPVTKGVGGAKEDDTVQDEEVMDEKNKWEELADKYDELADRVEQQLERDDQTEAQQPPMVQSPHKPTKEEWERHQLTHTPYEAWCPHCVAARAVRHKHPKLGRRPRMVNDNDGSTSGPIKSSMDYMYLYERDSGD